MRGFGTPYAAQGINGAGNTGMGATAGAGGIGGGLPWNAGGASGDYATAYNSALQMNQSNYNNILAGYQQTLAQQVGAQQAIGSGYTNLYNDVLGRVQGTNDANMQGINDSYAQQQGSASQSLINRGLGNTTIQSSVTRGIEADRAKAITQSQNGFAQLMAGYQSNLGQAGLGYQANAAAQNVATQQRQLDFMNSVQAQYPDAGQYAQLAQMKASQAAASRPGGMGGAGGGGYAAPSGQFGGFTRQTPYGGSVARNDYPTPGNNANAFYQPGGYNALPSAGAGMGYVGDAEALATGYAMDGMVGAGNALGGGGDALAALAGYAALQGGAAPAEAPNIWGFGLSDAYADDEYEWE